MRYAVFDTETTGFGTKDEVIQFSCLLTDGNFQTERAYTFYCYTQQAISKGAQAVHGIDKETLQKISEGKTFEDNLCELDSLLQLKDLTWIGYNIAYDIRLINQTLLNNGMISIDFGKKTLKLNNNSGWHTFDLMKALADLAYNGKPKKLIQAVKLLPYSEYQISSMYNKLLKLIGTEQVSKLVKYGAHNADYDTLVTWLLLNKFGEHFKV